MATVHELEELDRELDVADAAAPALELAIGEALARRVIVLRAGLHRPDLAHRVERRARRARRGACVSAHELGARARASPATGRALMSAWNSHVCAQRSQYDA